MCRGFNPELKAIEPKVNCANCVKYDRENMRCTDKPGMVKRYEETREYGVYARMMRENRSVVLDVP